MKVYIVMEYGHEYGQVVSVWANKDDAEKEEQRNSNWDVEEYDVRGLP